MMRYRRHREAEITLGLELGCDALSDESRLFLSFVSVSSDLFSWGQSSNVLSSLRCVFRVAHFFFYRGSGCSCPLSAFNYFVLARGVQPGTLERDVLSDERTLNCVICVKWHLSRMVSEVAFSMLRPFKFSEWIDC